MLGVASAQGAESLDRAGLEARASAVPEVQAWEGTTEEGLGAGMLPSPCPGLAAPSGELPQVWGP